MVAERARERAWPVSAVGGALTTSVMKSFLDQLLGLHVSAGDLTWVQITARTCVVFVFGVVLVRVADRRFLGRNAGFDVLLAIVLGSVLSRGINGEAPFFKTLGASFLLIVLHRAVGAIACHWPAFSKLAKGEPIVLVRNGRVDRDKMHAVDISETDLQENLRLNGNMSDIAEVAEARLERNGHISIIKRAHGA